MAGIFGEFFSGLRFPRNEARKLLKKFGENSERNSGQNFEKFGELSFCDFSDLNNRNAFLNASVLEHNSLNRNLSWGFPLGNLLPKTRVLERRVLERKREPNANASVLGTLHFRTLRFLSCLTWRWHLQESKIHQEFDNQILILGQNLS